MSRKVLLQLVLPLIGLSVLFWLLAFAPGDKHHQPALLEMSVILRDGDGNVSAMRKGMEQAAKDLNVELRFLTPAEDNSAVEQVQLLEHEVSGAAPAILLIPADREALGEAVSAAAGKTTLVTVESDMTAWGADASISMDHQALGEALGKAALNGVSSAARCCCWTACSGTTACGSVWKRLRHFWKKRAGRCAFTGGPLTVQPSPIFCGSSARRP